MSKAWVGILTMCLIAAVAANCARKPPESADRVVPEPVAVRWDGTQGAAAWTAAAMAALDAQGAPLVAITPTDIDAYCPAYAGMDADARKAFWVNLVASLSYHESTWRPDVSGGDGRLHGLLQISPATAQGYGCTARTAETLKVGAANVACAIRIMATTVPRDDVISRDMRGVAADWGPFHQARKRTDIQTYTQELPYCRQS